jgi:hypothetical protein
MADAEHQAASERERPGWAAIALIATFVLAGVVFYLVGVRVMMR